MENENVGKGSSESDIPISSRVDPTSVMPPFSQGPAVESMNIEDAAKEWHEMTLDSEGKYKTFPRSVFLSRLSALFKRGFGEKVTEQKKTQEQEGKEWLKSENARIADRNELEVDQKAKEINVKFFGNEKLMDQVVERAREVVNQLSKADGEFLKVCMPNSELAWGDNPLVIGFLANLRNDPNLIKKVKENGLEHYISLYSKLPWRVRR